MCTAQGWERLGRAVRKPTVEFWEGRDGAGSEKKEELLACVERQAKPLLVTSEGQSEEERPRRQAVHTPLFLPVLAGD